MELCRYYRRSLETLTCAEVQRFLDEIITARKLAWTTVIREPIGAEPPEPPPEGASAPERVLRLAGADVTLCPVCKPSHRCAACVASCRYALVEFDALPLPDQCRFWAGVIRSHVCPCGR